MIIAPTQLETGSVVHLSMDGWFGGGSGGGGGGRGGGISVSASTQCAQQSAFSATDRPALKSCFGFESGTTGLRLH